MNQSFCDRERRRAADDLYDHDIETEILERHARFPLRPRDGIAIQVGQEVNKAVRALRAHSLSDSSVRAALLPVLRVISEATQKACS